MAAELEVQEILASARKYSRHQTAGSNDKCYRKFSSLSLAGSQLCPRVVPRRFWEMCGGIWGCHSPWGHGKAAPIEGGRDAQWQDSTTR